MNRSIYSLFSIIALITLLGVSEVSFAAPLSVSVPVASSALPIYNAAKLRQFDGKSGHKAYVALNGYVYDVSDVDEWKGGHHYKGMVAGTDLTPYISQSPHGPGIVKQLGLKPIATYK